MGDDEQVDVGRMRLPRRDEGEMFGIADQLLGGSRLRVMCEDGQSRICRIPGKMKWRQWVRAGDLVILKPWDFQDEKGDIVWRFKRNQSVQLSRKGLIPDSVDIF